MKIEYPKWLYKAGQDAVIVHDQAEHAALAGFAESPQENTGYTPEQQSDAAPEQPATKRRGRKKAEA